MLTAGLLVGITVGLPFLHHHHDSVEEPLECMANIVETNLHSCQTAPNITLEVPHTRTADKIILCEFSDISTFDGFLFVNKAPPLVS